MFRKAKKVLSLVLATALAIGMMPAMSASAAGTSAIDPEEFMTPGIEYRPRVRWWLPGGAIEGEQIAEEIQWLYDNGFGGAELNSFGKNTSSLAPLDMGAHSSYLSDEYFEALEAAFAQANELGITLDLNMGSGWNANDPRLDRQDGQQTMTLGRATVEVTATTTLTTPVPVPRKTLTANNKNRYYDWPVNDEYEYDPELVSLQMVLVAPILQGNENTIGTNAVLVDDPLGRTQYIVDMDNAQMFDMKTADDQTEISWTPSTTGEHLVCAVYSVNTSERPHDDGVNGEDGYEAGLVVDHFNPEAIGNYMDLWLGDARLKSILDQYPDTIGSYFNDSYELKNDFFNNDLIYQKALDAGVAPYLPLAFRTGNSGAYFMSRSALFQTGSADTSVQDRIEYDVYQVVNDQWLEGLEAFQQKSQEYYGLYRQQPYNPYFSDDYGAGKYVDIPEGEGSESNLRRTGSTAHLYGRELATVESLTSGSGGTFRELPSNVKNVIDMQLTSGINQLYFHGYTYKYMGTEEQQANTVYGETGYSPMFTTGIAIHPANSLDYTTMNAYIARAQYLMQQGSPSVDVAIYHPNTTTKVAVINATTLAAGALNENGYGWDGINNDSILGARYEDGRIYMGYSDMHYGAIVVQNDAVPIDVMQKLKELADAGTTVIFYSASGTMPVTKQPSYMNGNYAEGDAQVVALANQVLAAENSGLASNAGELVELIGFEAPISYQQNANVRFIRRALETGGEVAYFRNTSTVNETEMIATVNDDSLVNHYILDQSTGKIHPVEAIDGKINITLEANGAIALLSEPAGAEIDSQHLTYGLPTAMRWVTMAEKAEQITLDTFDLTVTADNLGGSGEDLSRNGYLKNGYSGDTDTKTFTDIEPGSWNSTTYLNGALRYVNAPGIYTTTFEIAGGIPESYFLDLGTVYYTASVTVNDVAFGPIFTAPFVFDIAEALQAGENTLEIKVTPTTGNRYAGFRAAYNELSADDEERNLYLLYSGTNWGAMDAGLAGPVTLTPAINSVLRLSTDAYHVEAGDYANITTRFVEPVNSNTAIIHYTFDTNRFQCADFHEGDNVRVISKEATDTGAKVVVMISDYNTQTYGRLAIQAKPDAVLSTGRASVRAEVEYVVRDEAGEKTINTAIGIGSFTTFGEGDDDDNDLPKIKGDTNLDGVVDLIDLSNMIDWFGTDGSDARWNSWYTYFDFNSNGEIDIYDIAYIAQLIK